MEIATRQALSDAYKRWCALLQTITTHDHIHTLVHPSTDSPPSSSFHPPPPPFRVHWKKTLVNISNRKKAMGITLTKSHFGVMVLNMTPESPLQYLYSVLQGALLLEINGVTVLLESFESVTKTLHTLTATGMVQVFHC